MSLVRAKKHLGQHFLNDLNIAQKIVESIQFSDSEKPTTCIEIGAGMGVLTQYLVKKENYTLYIVEIDTESVTYLHQHYPELKDRIYEKDFLKLNLQEQFSAPMVIIGNFPYNISSQIFFKVLDYKEDVQEVVCMIQKEVAERIASKPGNKSYGILSVLLQAWYDIEYLFTVNEHVFTPPPKVKSAVIRLKRNKVKQLSCDESFFKTVVKTAFNQRRKTIRNSVKSLTQGITTEHNLFQMRPEQLTVAEFVELTNLLGK